MENLKIKANTLTQSRNNPVTLTGFVGTTPEFKNLGRDFKLAEFALGIKAKMGNNPKTYWHKIIAFGRYAEFINRELKKGNRIWLKGEVIERTYVAQNGETKSVREISLQAVRKLDNRDTKTIN